jgi:hypothetical protein
MGAPILNAIEKRAIGFLQEGDGSQSSSRLCMVLVVVFALGFITALLWKVRGPITVAEFCQAVGSLGMFTGGVCGALYGINRFGECLDNRAGRAPNQ